MRIPLRVLISLSMNYLLSPPTTSRCIPGSLNPLLVDLDVVALSRDVLGEAPGSTFQTQISLLQQPGPQKFKIELI